MPPANASAPPPRMCNICDLLKSRWLARLIVLLADIVAFACALSLDTYISQLKPLLIGQQIVTIVSAIFSVTWLFMYCFRGTNDRMLLDCGGKLCPGLAIEVRPLCNDRW
jgi:hypothetical protein